MGAIVLLLEDDVLAIPGEETRRPVQVCNSGTVVDRFELDIVGEARHWIHVEPAEVNVFPDQSVGAELVFTPPRSADIPAGEVTFALRVMSHEDIEGSVVEEATVTVGPFTDYGVKLVPRTKRTRWGTRFNAVVDNRGNAPLRVRLFATDADSGLGFRFAYPEIEVARGKGTVAPVKVKPRTRRWRGADVTLPFQVLAVPCAEDSEEEQTADGALVQAALLSDAVVKFVMAVVAAILALLALWLFVLKPSVESEARRQANAIDQETTPPGDGASRTPSPGGPPGPVGGGLAGGAGVPSPSPPPPDIGPADGGGDGGNESGNPDAGTSKPPGGAGEPSADSEAFDFRIPAEVPVSAEFNQEARFTVPEGTTLWISDVVYENVAGDEGIIRLQRGDSTLRQLALDTFRNHQENYDQPIRFGPGEAVVLAVRCTEPGARPDTEVEKCTPAAYFSGRLVGNDS
ncbi:hypothetical protein [Streptomyces sp. NPDC085932]|uniref:hypothetical protein n=1 Tax=Streptomyces sp. NPDC085932 TaxID=3365741 RepID=UPI0037D9269E